MSVFDERLVDRALEELELEAFGPQVLESTRSEALQRVSDLHNLVSELSHPDDLDELYRSIAFFWLELRFAWTRHNQIVQYQSVFRGQAEPLVVGRGTMCAHLLSLVESLLRPADLETLANLAGEPLAVGSPDIERIERFIAQHRSRMDGLARVVAHDAPLREFATTELELIWPVLAVDVRAAVDMPELELCLEAAPDAVIDVRRTEALRVALTEAVKAVASAHGPTPTAWTDPARYAVTIDDAAELLHIRVAGARTHDDRGESRAVDLARVGISAALGDDAQSRVSWTTTTEGGPRGLEVVLDFRAGALAPPVGTAA